MINILTAINNNQVEQFFDNFRFEEGGARLATDFAPFTIPDTEHTIDVYGSDCDVHMATQGHWKVNGADNKTLVSIYISDIVYPDWSDPTDPDPKDVLAVINYMRQAFPGPIQILDAFKKDGLRHGEELIPATYDELGDEVTPETIMGTPTYPPNPSADTLLYMPDVITYDTNGDVVSTTQATTRTEVNKLYGWNDRKW